MNNRAVLTGITFVLRTGILWREIPAELGCGVVMTCFRWLKWWHRNGVFQKLYAMLLVELIGVDMSDGSCVPVDSATTKTSSGGEKTGPNPTDRCKLGSKVQVLDDTRGISLAIQVTGANTHDVTQVIPQVDRVPKVRGQKGRPRHSQTGC